MQALARDDDHCGDVGGLKDEYLNRKIPFVKHLTRLGNKKDCLINLRKGLVFLVIPIYREIKRFLITFSI